ncbi:OB-fold nucleic acid binding domain-containing protein [Arthrobacter sp. EPSL27]|uniref:OB-fold nucleic acid binding domain-containing protein n=1 Tax=Arthrobacter sp. EPSL27 TaxID=1745378 RepID=UPI000745F8E7|nr:OB-fold nucleic acid binding domain-containing protein [Arthrobacter sp. EPSL27]KUM37613.1 hypothetical protein AR539_10260 [Arthrobacter sp. EPSL27]
MVDAPRKDPASSVSVGELPDRGRVLCHGFIESVTYAPSNQVAAFTAVVIDHNAPPAKARRAAAQPTAVQATAVQAAAARPAGNGRRQRPAGAKGRLRVVWLGRRRIPGIEAGTELRLQGMVTVRDGLPTMFNPRYEILSRQEEQ